MVPARTLQTVGHHHLGWFLLSESEGAFLPCTFWLPTIWAMAGRPDEAETILDMVEPTAGELGLCVEEVDMRTGLFRTRGEAALRVGVSATRQPQPGGFGEHRSPKERKCRHAVARRG